METGEGRNSQDDLQRKDISSSHSSHLEAGLTRPDDMELADQFKKAGEQIQNRGIYGEKPQNTWSRFKSYFDRDRTKAENVANQDHISQEQAEFRAAGNQLTKEKNQPAKEAYLSQQFSRKSPDATNDDLEYAVFAKTFEGKKKNSVVAKKPVENVVTKPAVKEAITPQDYDPLPFDNVKKEKTKNRKTDQEKPSVNDAVLAQIEARRKALQYKDSEKYKISYFMKDGVPMKSIMEKTGDNTWQYSKSEKVSQSEYDKNMASAAKSA